MSLFQKFVSTYILAHPIVDHKQKKSLLYICMLWFQSIENLEMNFPTPFDVRTLSYCFFNFLCTYKSVSCDELRFSCESILWFYKKKKKEELNATAAGLSYISTFKCFSILIQMFDIRFSLHRSFYFPHIFFLCGNANGYALL